MEENTEHDLFEEEKQMKQSIKAKGVAKMKEKVPASEILYKENNALNQILAKKTNKIEVVELDEDEDEDVDADVTKEKVIAQLKALGIDKETIVKANISRIETKSLVDSNIDDLKDDDISKYIGVEEEDSKDNLFD